MEMEAVPQSELKKSKGHKCYFCGLRFANVHILRKHVNTHKDRDMECKICGKTYSSQCGLKKHMMIHTGERPFTCSFCEKSFRQKCTLLSHIQCLHNSSKTKRYCSTCGKRLKPSDRDFSQCWICKYAEKSECKSVEFAVDLWGQEEEIQMPEGDIHSSSVDVYEPEVSINECLDSTISQELVVIDDSLKIGQMQPISCLMCSESFPSIIHLRQHTTDVHKNTRLFMCKECGNRFSTHIALKNHMTTHNEERPFMCLTCGKSFKSQVALQSHLNTHREDRPYLCKVCDATFKTFLSLRIHAITHQTERPFICKQCSYPFKTLDRLKKHIIVHTDNKPYKCHTCFKEFKHPGNLGRHYYLHVGQRLFICRVCGKDFTQSGGLKQHEQVHNKEYDQNKKLSCPLCHKTYKLDVMLQRHLVSHQ